MQLEEVMWRKLKSETTLGRYVTQFKEALWHGGCAT